MVEYDDDHYYDEPIQLFSIGPSPISHLTGGSINDNVNTPEPAKVINVRKEFPEAWMFDSFESLRFVLLA